jgi:hypothetical protein
MVKWFASKGLILLNTQGATIDEELKRETDPFLLRALSIVRELGRASTAKYQAMQRWVCPDGRVRGAVCYITAQLPADGRARGCSRTISSEEQLKTKFVFGRF